MRDTYAGTRPTRFQKAIPIAFLLLFLIDAFASAQINRLALK